MISRRQLLIRAAQVTGGMAIPSLLAACQAPAPAAPTAAAKPAAATSAPAATSAAPAATSAAPAGTSAAPATAATAAPAAAKKGGTLRFAYFEEFRTLDPHFSLQVGERYMMYSVYNTLVGMDEGFNPVPELAESWTNPDDKSYVFKLRQGVKFHDGTDFDASVVKWNIDRLKDPATKSPRATDLAKVDSVDVVDKYTVKFNLTQPFAPLLAVMMDRPGFMVSPAAVQKSGADYGRNPVGTGPFKFVSWTQDQGAVVERNPSYWSTTEPYVDGVQFKLNPDPTVRVTMLKSGEADLIDRFDTKDVASLQADPNLNVLQYHGGQWYALQWWVNTPPFDKKEVRQAVGWALNKEALGKIEWSGYGDIPNGPITIALGNPEGVKPIGYDVAKAKDLLAQAGVANGFEATLVVRSRPDDVRLGELVQSQLGDVGIKVTLGNINPNDWTVATQNHTIDWTTTSWTQRGDPDGLLSILFNSKGSANTTYYDNPQVDDMLSKAAAIYDPAQRKTMYTQIQQTIVDDAPYIYLWRPAFFYASTKKIAGVQDMPDNILRTRTVRFTA